LAQVNLWKTNRFEINFRFSPQMQQIVPQLQPRKMVVFCGGRSSFFFFLFSDTIFFPRKNFEMEKSCANADVAEQQQKREQTYTCFAIVNEPRASGEFNLMHTLRFFCSREEADAYVHEWIEESKHINDYQGYVYTLENAVCEKDANVYFCGATCETDDGSTEIQTCSIRLFAKKSEAKAYACEQVEKSRRDEETVLGVIIPVDGRCGQIALDRMTTTVAANAAKKKPKTKKHSKRSGSKILDKKKKRNTESRRKRKLQKKE
jgi:hypothetical protein